MKAYKQLAGQTVIYGLSSIVGRLLNVLLVPIYTRVFEVGEYGVVTQLYSFIALFNVLFTYGLETAFFRFFLSEKGNSKVYSTNLISIFFSSILFAVLIIIFSDTIAVWIFTKKVVSGANGASFSLYIKYFAGILACDAVTAIPFAKLRQENRAKRFAFVRFSSIVVYISLNLFFIVLCPLLAKNGSNEWIKSFYDPTFGVGYVFLANLIASAVTLLMLWPEIFKIHWEFDAKLWRQMIIYAFPLMIAGFAGIINETFDRILIPYLISDRSEAMIQVGIYGACYKLSIIMNLFVQTFRYAAEPFFFNHSTKDNPQRVYAQVMKVFVIICALIFLGVMLYIDIVKQFIGPDFRSGLKVVPILLMANLCLGVFYNLSIWYKLTAKTRWGAWLSVYGAVITLVFNFLLIPIMGYMGAAWATLICYASMMAVSYYIGQKHYPVSYDLKSFFYYITLALAFWGLSLVIQQQFAMSYGIMLTVNTLLIIVFILITGASERRNFGYLRAD